MIWIVLLAVTVALLFSPVLRCAVSHPVAVPVNSLHDLYIWLTHREYDRCQTGELVAYTGLFGKGKTLSVVHRVVSEYNRCNGKMVWCPRRQKMVAQRVKVISNVSLAIPYEEFVSLEQVVYAAEHNREFDDANDTLTVTLVLGDEFSVQMNSRKFKDNIDPLLLNTILTCRHHYISLYYTAQRFGHVDALLRQVTSYVVENDKLWRFQRQKIFDAWDLENATNTEMIKPLRRSCWFVRDRDYYAYDTLACVGNLKKSFSEGDMMTEKEILELQQNQQANMEGVSNPSRRWLRRHKAMKK